MSGKFTPPPWIWTEDRYGQRLALRRSGSGDVVLDPQADVSDFGLRTERWIDVSDEDARLIASAPAMHAALEKAEAALRAVDTAPIEYADAVFWPQVSEARTAIEAALALSHPLEEKS